jgi:maleate cis-trans isomerase
MAARAFAPALAEAGGEYLRRFVTEAPMFGRETRDLMMDVPLKEPEAAVAAGRSRLDLLSRLDAASLAPASREHLEYFRDYERFMLAFFETHRAWELSDAMRKVGAWEDARREIGRARPEEVIRLYARAVRHGGASRGEQALVISLNLRWLPYIQSTRQALGLDPVRVKFGATQHEPLAQSPGRHTFFIDPEGRQWLVQGERETGAPAAPEGGIRITKPVALRMTAFAGEKLAPGRYILELEFAPPSAAALEMEITDGGQTLETERVRAGVTARFPLEIRAGVVEVKLRPASGEAVLLSATLTPGR